MLHFNYAQTFYLDASAVKNASEVALTKVDLFVRAKPPATNNKSGISSPGIEIMFVPCMNGVPVINQLGAYRPTEPTEHGAKFAFYSGGQIARVEYESIQASYTAAVPTEFLFNEPVFVKTNQEYAILIRFDGNENYVLWSSRQGNKLVGTDKISPGPSGKFIGNLYKFIDNPNKNPSGFNNIGYGFTNTAVSTSTNTNPALIYTPAQTQDASIDSAYLQANWTPIPNEDLKFRVYVARYAYQGFIAAANSTIVGNSQVTSMIDRSAIPAPAAAVTSNNIVTLTAPCETPEYILFDVKSSIRNDLVHGEPIYQVTPSYPGYNGTPLTVNCYPNLPTVNTQVLAKSIYANGNYLMPGGVTFNSIGGFNSVVSQDSFMVVTSSTGERFIVQVDQIVSNTQLLVSPPFEKTVTNATFSISPIGYLNDVSRSIVFGKSQDLLTLYNSIANSTNRFVGKTIETITISNGGNGYSNSDYIRIGGYEDVSGAQGNYYAYANVLTDSNGTIVNTFISNAGCGFTNTAYLTGSNVSIFTTHANGVPTTTLRSTSNAATLTFDTGATLKSIFTNTAFKECEVINLEAGRMKPEITVNNPSGSGFTIRHRTLYHMVPSTSTSSKKAYYINTPEEQALTDTYAKIFKSHTLNLPNGKAPIIPSRSNEFAIRYANGALNTANVQGTPFSNSSLFLFDISSNNDYQAVYFDPEIVNSHYSKYVINNDYSDEHTNYGSAWAKHVGTKINFSEDRFAEDILVYLTAYRPANTDIKVLARIHNSNDEEAFDDKDWTLLEEIEGAGVYSSKDNSADFIELTYNLRAYPNTDITMNGGISISQGNAVVTGIGTDFAPRVIINNGGTAYTNGDIIQFAPATQSPQTTIFAYTKAANAVGVVNTNGSGVITNVVFSNVGFGWSTQANVSSFAITNSTGGSTGGSSANLYFVPGLQANDLVKIYSAYQDFANTTYTIAVVNSVTNSTSFTVKNTFGALGANQTGNVTVTTSTTLEGVGTTTAFTSEFSSGDFIAVWANSSVYEVRKISSITDANTLVVDTAFTISNTSTKYARVTPDTFINTSLTVSNLKVDRLAFKNQAFNNIQNDNVARYYNSSLVAFDGYDTFQIKVVLLSENDTIVPKIDDIRGVLVSA